MNVEFLKVLSGGSHSGVNFLDLVIVLFVLAIVLVLCSPSKK